MMNILVVDDERLVRWSIRERLVREGYRVTEAEDGRSALAALDTAALDLVLLDLKLPDMDGMEILQEVQRRAPELPVILITAHASVETAIEAMKRGAFDYVSKPFNMDELSITIRRALETTALRREREAQARDLKALHGVHAIIGRSKAVQDVVELVRKVARSEATTVLLRGESGTGKDMVARAIHYESPRAAKPFLNITCTALQDTLLESELFGHEKGSFTDAKAQKRGLFELADGGSVFLDEIGDMSPLLQSKVLRAIEEKAFRRIGGTQDIAVDVRVIAATNSNLDELIAQKRFREDLFYRLNVISIEMPPLRARSEDIPLLARHFVDRYAREFRRAVTGVEPEALARLQAHTWPGNVRELRNVIERAMLLGNGPVVRAADLWFGPGPRGAEAAAGAVRLPETGLNFEELERDLVRQALERAHGNQTQAGRLLAMTRDQIRYRMEKFGFLKASATV